MNPLGEADAAVWMVRAPERPLARHLELLSSEEQHRCQRFVPAERQARFVTGRALLRCLLSEMLAMPAREVPLTLGNRQRPGLASSAQHPGSVIDVNLSSTKGIVACALARNLRVGVDVERPRGGVDEAALAQRLYTEEEQSWVSGSTPDSHAFYRLWTLKESVSKADGEGVGLPFGLLTVLPREDGTIELDLAAMDENAEDWHVMELASEVPAALALRRGADAAGTPGLSKRFSADLTVNLAPDLPAGSDFEALPVGRRNAHVSSVGSSRQGGA